MEKVNQHNVDVKENLIREIYPELLELLLKDCTTKRNIIWATNDYSELGDGFNANDEITVDAITGANGNVIMPRSVKSKEKQGERTRNMAEVFTPTWICNKMNNLVDSAWFGKEGIFNIECNTEWASCIEKITFPNKNKPGIGSWMNYLAAKRLEITCGEAPYLVSRYNTVTGEPIPLEQRIGILDRKLRVINEKVRNFQDKDRAKKRWLQLAKLALQSTYGFEWQGDNVLLARENLLYTVVDYFQDKFSEEIAKEWLLELGTIIAWNIWQMDGIKCVVPDSCHDYKKPRKMVEPSLFDSKALSATTLKRSMSLCDVNEEELQKCQGCLKDNVDLHNGIYCKIKNWSNGKIYKFKDLLNKQESGVDMSKDFKFDVIIGNPPYQVEDQGSGKSAKPVYHFYVNEAKTLNPEYISMIIPSRWFTGGKGLVDFRQDMLSDDRLCKLVDFENFRDVFPDVDLAGGACFFLWDGKHNGECEVSNATSQSVLKLRRNLNEFEVFVRSNKSIVILRKILELNNGKRSLSEVVSSRKPFGLPTNYKPLEEGVPCWFIQKIGKKFAAVNDVDDAMGYLNKWKLIAPKSPIAGQTDFTKPVGFYYDGNTKIAAPGECCTESFLVLGAFDTEEEVLSYKSYIFTKLVRFLLLQSVVSQDVTKKNFCFIPDMGVYNRIYSDDILREMWNITDDEWNYVNSRIGYSHEFNTNG